MLFFLCFICSFFYAGETVLADRKLSHVSPLVLTFFSGIGITVISGLCILFSEKELAYPKGNDWWSLVFVIVLFFLADLTHFWALNAKAGAVLLASFYLLIPVMASVLKFEIPSRATILSWILAGIAVLVLAQEMSQKK